ncbi:hypothetical protein HG536_0G04340 [Torulaspora globosa]|uniref:Uncharacterized protein n=1 Tax=Torulaspora globosa TaxID=48254 RepID=A0A7G3ZM36_9SACH|nr:uncharacterized protein HG536_0G04340 [Torulaspora globosa]QLL34572.1 hypothetical protein HG536_0G04340 [Torulaspora globosa]
MNDCPSPEIIDAARESCGISHATEEDYFQWDPQGRGDLWICNQRRTVEWFVGGQSIRKFSYDQSVIKAGFVNFATVSNCLVIIFKDVAYVYYLSNGDSTTVCFPFNISNAFWYSQGVVLERQSCLARLESPEMEAQHKFITLSDPMAPFGFITFSAQQKNDDGLRNFRMLMFPKDEDHNITVLYDVHQLKLHFYYTTVLDIDPEIESGKKDYIANSGSPTNVVDPSKNLRKISILNRRVNSTTTAHEINDSAQTDGINAFQPGAKPTRSMSATVDRMSGSSTSPTVDFSANPIQQPQQQSDFLSQTISSKNVQLTKISSMTLPHQSAQEIEILQCVALRLQDQEAITIFDGASNFSKVWIIDLIPDVINSISFRLYGNSPQELIRLSNLDTQQPVDDILPFCSTKITGTLALMFDNRKKICLYNPFVELETPQLELPSENLCFISDEKMIFKDFDLSTKCGHYEARSDFPYPHKSSIKLCFEAIKWICPPGVFYAIIFLWQFVVSNHDWPRQDREFLGLKYIISSLISPADERITINLSQINAFRYLTSADPSCLVPKIIMGLHLVREELALNILAKKDVQQLGDFLFFATSKMGWPAEWRLYYGNGSMELDSNLIVESFAHPLDEPPSILKSLYSVTENSQLPTTPFICFSRLAERDSQVDQLVTPKTFKTLRLYELTRASNYTDEYLMEILTKLQIDKEDIETYPLGVMTPLRKILGLIEQRLSRINVNLDMSTISRPDIERCMAMVKQIDKDIESSHRRFQAFKPYYIKGESKPESKGIYTILTDVIKSTRQFTLEKTSFTDNNHMDDFDEGSTLKRNAGMIFSEDHRLNYVLSLLTYYRPHKVHFISKESNYRKLLNQKKMVAKIMSIRTCTSGIGFGAVAYATEKPLVTQKWSRQQLNFSYIFPDGSKLSVQASDLNTEMIEWGDFHSGVSSGLRISKKAKGINGSWIAFSRPKILDAQLGGFLLGLGLNGHLSGLEEWHVYNYLSPKKSPVSIGLLLGMSASMRGTMDLKLTKVLSVHTVAFLPPGSSDLNINLRVQTAGLIGMGLLYLKSQHRRITDVLFSQLPTFIMINEEPVSDEGYRLATGIALGLINLGAGKSNGDLDFSGHADRDDAPDFSSSNATGPDERVVIGLLQFVRENRDVEESWIPENSQTGAIIALMLIFLKTHNRYISNSIKPKLDQTSNIRPELFMYREWAYYMIMWDEIGRDLSFMLDGLGKCVEPEITTDNLATYYTIAGRILAIGIRHASTGDRVIRDSLLLLMDKFLPFYQYPGTERLDFRLSIDGINTLINVLSVSVSMVMCGTGDLSVMRRLRYLEEVTTGRFSDLFKTSAIRLKRRIIDPSEAEDLQVEGEADISGDTGSQSENELNEGEQETIADGTQLSDLLNEENHFAKFLATNLSLGFLFLGSGQYALKTSELECIAHLIITALPTYTSKCPLQETKHFWSMAVEPRCLVIRDASTEKIINNVPFEVTVKVNDSFDETRSLVAPCLLPDIRKLRSLRINNAEYFPLEIKFDNNLSAADFFQNGTILYIQPKKHNGLPTESFPSRSHQAKQIERALKARMEALDKDLERDELFLDGSSTDRLIDRWGFEDTTMAELRTMTTESLSTEHGIYGYDLDMLCSDVNNGDVGDYQLEIWRKKQKI